MYNKILVTRIQEIFAEKLSSKTGWGRNEILLLHQQAVSEAALEIVDDYASLPKEP